ncbi:HAMP domain-containing histidine kinase [Candidatus Parcubacteria bacterium]|nr:HAMP domain-containing histidine kinase [Candidatus Parcubacteria bacterium]
MEEPTKKTSNKIVKTMPKGQAEPLFIFLFVKACLGFLISVVLSCPLVNFFLRDIFLYFFFISSFLLILHIFKSNEEDFSSKLALSSSLIDILFFLLLAWRFVALSEFFFLFIALILAEAVLALWLFSLLIKNLFLSQRVKKQVETSFVSLQEKLSQIKKQNKQIKELLKMKEEFLKIANHQLRTPVSVIRGLADMLKEKKLPQIQKKEAQNNLILASQHLASILDDLLLAQSILGDCPKPIFVEVKLISLIENILIRFEDLIKQRKIKVIFLKPKQEINVFLDQELTQNVIFRLLENALLYSKNKDITINLQKKLLKDKESQIEISIKDRGIGFSSREKKNLFTLFYRSRLALLESPNGSGLGLYIAKHFLEIQGGSIKITSPGKNKGCEVLVSLPFKELL